ncbi:MAG: HAMP domain-containing sensor histidine kinase [Clostridiales bacterium]|uniref:histidine kinase n=1 Tax=Intestinimonas massiliensis (ex Afouda et al. 2020) TaxID=1673721 RepID=A0ABS9M7S5_9FIRM|nr:HAMP domain-containing histidine kinase [Intestinimonas massiliensis (ex Afouda et al. 2020)]MCQ4806119.1 HAMP domain-containing histidine kinase [Intestinimonas massiliensis (ex Afouda et al. 2020)]MDU1324646.1 HAMP domain-containing sensor histidine kinase [Clostridiales bacterium]
MIAAVILAALCAVLGLRLYALEKDIRSCARQLREDEGARVRMAAPNRAAEDLLSAVNRLLELREADEAEHRRQEHAIRQQISNISHDLRTPLTSILGYLQLLEGDSLTVEERREYLGIVRGRAKALQSLITSFYDLSRLEGGEYPLSREKVDLYHVLSELVAEFYNDFEQSGFDMTVELAPGLPAVTADPAGVLRVFTNLIRNALEHGQKRMSILLYRQGETVVSAFSNDAAGLTREDVEHVFDRFFTADKMRTGQSTGLGLAIVKALVGQMGHRVTAALDGEMFTVQVRWRI